VTFFGVFPVTCDLRAPNSRQRTERRRGSNVRVNGKNGAADYERKKIADRAIRVNGK